MNKGFLIFCIIVGVLFLIGFILMIYSLMVVSGRTRDHEDADYDAFMRSLKREPQEEKKENDSKEV